jgi:hypothetical protein
MSIKSLIMIVEYREVYTHPMILILDFSQKNKKREEKSRKMLTVLIILNYWCLMVLLSGLHCKEYKN